MKTLFITAPLYDGKAEPDPRPLLGLILKQGGWDYLRHYELLASARC